MLATFVGILVGVILGMTGAGGSIVAVPLLILLLDLSIHDATGVALGTVAIASITGLLLRSPGFSRSLPLAPCSLGSVMAPAVVMAVIGMLTAPVGRMLATNINEMLLLIGFAGLANFLAVRMWLHASADAKQAIALTAVGSSDHASEMGLNVDKQAGPALATAPAELSTMVAPGAGIGLLSGFFGVGGGFLIVPILRMYLKISVHEAIGVSLLVISLVSTSGFFFHVLQAGGAAIPLLIQTSIGSVLGVVLGSLIAQRLSCSKLQKVFAVTVACLTAATLLQALA